MNLIERLEELAEATRIRTGRYHEYFTILEAIEVLKSHEPIEDEPVATQAAATETKKRTKRTTS